MESLYLLIPVALVLVALGIKLLLWAIDDGQYEDLDKEAWRILADESPPEGRAEKPVANPVQNKENTTQTSPEANRSAAIDAKQQDPM